MRVSVANQAMQNTPHLSPLPSTEGRGEAWIFREAHARRQHAIIVIIISILAMAARLILINQPYVDHWSWRQSDVAAISRFFCKTDFVSAVRKLLGRAMRPVTSEPSVQFCRSLPQFVTSPSHREVDDSFAQAEGGLAPTPRVLGQCGAGLPSGRPASSPRPRVVAES